MTMHRRCGINGRQRERSGWFFPRREVWGRGRGGEGQSSVGLRGGVCGSDAGGHV